VTRGAGLGVLLLVAGVAFVLWPRGTVTLGALESPTVAAKGGTVSKAGLA